jgi:hypothetical protein
MSVSRQEVSSENPLNIFYSFNGRDAVFERKETGQPKTQIGKKLQFVILEDKIETVKGYSEATGSYSSNYGRIGEYATFIVRNHKNGGTATIAEGKYKDIKANLPEKAKYTRVLYIYNTEAKEYGVLGLSGSQLFSYGECLDNLRTGAGMMFAVRKSTEKKNGAVTYYVPVFECRPLKDEESGLLDTVIDFDRDTLQPYLDGLTGVSAPVQDTPSQPESTDTSADDDLPF